MQRGEVVGVPALRPYPLPSRPYRPQRGGEDDAYFDRLSTGLKVLSRSVSEAAITEPTEGAPRNWRAETVSRACRGVHGRVGSLLEVVS